MRSAGRSLAALLFLTAGIFAAGCETTPPLTQTQWEAIETRQIEGHRNDVLRAACSVILDEGYFYTASDQAAGTVTAARVPSSQRDLYQREGGMTGPVIVDTISIWVLQTDPATCNLRVQYRDFGRHVPDQERVTKFWTSVQRRMLKADPVAAPPAPTAAGGA